MGTEKTIRVVLADDHIQMHKIIQTILGGIPDIKLVAQGANGQDALQLCEQFQPDVLLLDVVMPLMDGIEATKVLHERFPGMKILALSSFQDHESVHKMLQHGAAGYITKSSLSHDLVDTIRATYSGKRVFSDDVMPHLLTPTESAQKENFHLTSRELEVLALMAEGLNMPEMAGRLVISQFTVKFHVENICRKMKVRTRSEALILAAKNNLV